MWFPHWPLQRLRAAQPELEGCGLVLHTPGTSTTSTLTACSRQAQAQGLRPGMPLGEALALAAAPRVRIHFDEHDPAADRRELSLLAERAIRYAPVVALDTSPHGDSLLIDLAGAERLYPDESRLAETIHHDFASLGWKLRIALADTVGAAWAMAHFGSKRISAGREGKPAPRGAAAPWLSIIPRGPASLALALADLPIAALRTTYELAEQLAELGLRRIGQIEALPRASLPSRFGKELLLRLDQALGRTPELLEPVRITPTFEAEYRFEPATTHPEWLRSALDHVLGEILRRLRARHEGISRLDCRLIGEDRAVVPFTVRLLRPSMSLAHLAEMTWLEWQRQRLRAPIAILAIEAAATASPEIDQTELFLAPGDRHRPAEFAALVERLSHRLGSGAVLRLHTAAEAQPELAMRSSAWIASPAEAAAPIGARRSAADSPAATSAAAALATLAGYAPPPSLALYRPLRLVAVPLRLVTEPVRTARVPTAIRPGDRWLEVLRSEGPERIETGWWRGAGVRRDYYRVETEAGLRFWLFRDLKTGRWHLHGDFS